MKVLALLGLVLLFGLMVVLAVPVLIIIGALCLFTTLILIINRFDESAREARNCLLGVAVFIIMFLLEFWSRPDNCDGAPCHQGTRDIANRNFPTR